MRRYVNMHNRLLLFSLFLFVVIEFGGCSSQPQSTLPLQQPALDRALRIDRVIISGQPTELEIRSLRQRGISQVVNVRTPEEMNDVAQVNFDEAKLLRELNIDYDSIPIGGDKYPYRPEVLDAFARIMQTSKDSVLLHCKTAGRARWLYAAYEIKHLNKSIDEVMKSLERYGFWPLPIEKLIGTPMRIDKKE
jgi:protein tyrosine phosphatase (PTP) superfamily phosphohydrolase (DUF442 family)